MSLADYSPWGHKELDRTEHILNKAGVSCCPIPPDIVVHGKHLPFCLSSLSPLLHTHRHTQHLIPCSPTCTICEDMHPVCPAHSRPPYISFQINDFVSTLPPSLDWKAPPQPNCKFYRGRRPPLSSLISRENVWNTPAQSIFELTKVKSHIQVKTEVKDVS